MNIGKKNLTKQQIKDFFGKHWPVLLILLLGIVIPLIWFREGLLIAGGDDSWYLNPAKYFKESFSVWLDNVNLGAPNVQVHFIFPVVSFWAFLKTIGISLVNIERLWMILLFVLPGLTLYYLVTRLMGGDEEGKMSSWVRVAGFIGALLYMFNMYVAAHYSTITIRPIQIVLPLILLFWIKGLRKQKLSLKYPLIIGLLFTFTFASQTNVAAFAVVPITLLSYWVLYIVTLIPKFGAVPQKRGGLIDPFKERFAHSLKFCAVVLGVFLIVNFWWLATSFVAGLEVSGEIGEFIKPSHFIAQTHLWDAFRFLGSWSFRILYGASDPPIPHIPYSPTYYNNPVIIIFSYLIPFLAFLAVVFKPRNKNVLFFGFLTIIGLFLTKGTNAPLGNIFKDLFDNVPGFWVFRNPYSRFSLIHVLGISVLLGIFIGLIYEKMNNWPTLQRKKLLSFVPKLLPFFVGVLILSTSFPLLTGKIIQDESWHGLKRESMHVKVPEYWQEASQWLKNNDPEARVFLLPKTGYGHCYVWESGTCVGDPVAQTLLSNPLVYFPTSVSNKKDKLIAQLYTAVDTNNKEELLALLRFFNIKYILQQNDVDWTYGLMVKSKSPGQLKAVLGNQEYLTYLKSFGKLDLYRVKDDYFTPVIYIPEQVTYIDGKVNNIVDLIEDKKEKVAILSSLTMDDTQKELTLANLSKVNNVFIRTAPVLLGNELEHKLDIPEDGEYEIFLNQGYARPDLEYCADCQDKARIQFKWLSPPTGYIDDRLFSLQPKLEKELSFALLPEESKKLEIVGPWSFVQGIGKNADIYESVVPLPFPEDYITKPGTPASFLVFRGSKQLKKYWEAFPDEVDLVKISSNPPFPRRLFVTVPKGTEPEDNYWVFYLDHTFSLREMNPKLFGFGDYISLGSLNFTQGGHKVRISPTDSFTNPDDMDDFNLLLKLKGKRVRSFYQPSMEFKKLAPYKYKVSINKAAEPFFLIFNEGFHPKWQAYLKKGGSVSKNQHFMANNFANAWFIKPPPGEEDFEIILRYQPQWLYFLGLIVLGVFIVFALTYLVRRRQYDSE